LPVLQEFYSNYRVFLPLFSTFLISQKAIWCKYFAAFLSSFYTAYIAYPQLWRNLPTAVVHVRHNCGAHYPQSWVTEREHVLY